MKTNWRETLEAEKGRIGRSPQAFGRASPKSDVLECLVNSVYEFGIFMLDVDGHILTWNRGAQRIKLYGADEVVGRHFRMLYIPEDQAPAPPEKNLRDALKYGQTEDIGWRMKKDGSRFWADAVITAIMDEEGKAIGYAKVIRDLTEINKAEVHARALDVSAKVDSLKEQFLSLISHELRTPLTAIRGYADLVEDGSAGPTTPVQDMSMQGILKATDAMTRLVNDLIEMSTFHAGSLQLERQPVNFSELVLGTVFAVQARAQEKQLWLANHVNPTMPDILADPERVSQILVHLLDNAIKFTSAGGRIDVCASIDGGILRCEVSDTGRGLTLETMESLFKDFRQGNMSSTRDVGGLGIGLALCKALVELHGGKMGVLSREGKGSTFWFTLPAEAPGP